MLAVLETELPIGMRPVSHEAGKYSDGGTFHPSRTLQRERHREFGP